MKQTIDGTQLWNIEEIAKSDMHNVETFNITVGSIKNFYNKYKMLQKQLQDEKLKVALLESQIKEQSRFVVFA